MKKRIAVTAVCLILTVLCCGCGETESAETSKDMVISSQQSGDIDYTANELETLNKGSPSFEIKYLVDQKTATGINGKISERFVKNENEAFDAICGVRTLIGLTDPEQQLKFVTVYHVDGMTSYRFIQLYEGLEVYPQHITLTVDSNTGETLRLTSELVPDAYFKYFNITPKITFNSIYREYSETVLPEDISLKIYMNQVGNDIEPVLAYIIDGGAFQLVADANSGEIIKRLRVYDD